MDDNGQRREFDLEERTYLFAKAVRAFVKQLPRTACNECDVRQVARSSGSVAANYIEANEALSKKDFICRLKIARKECKETRLWLRLVDSQDDPDLESIRVKVIQECQEIRSILSSILKKSE